MFLNGLKIKNKCYNKARNTMAHKANYSKFFTPPKFLAMPAVSLELVDNAFCFLSTKNRAEGLLPEKYGQVDFEAGSIIHSEIIKRDSVIKALKEIRQRTNVNCVRFSIPEEKTYIFKTHLPELEVKEIHDILDFKLEENIPLSSKEAVFDFDIVPKNQSQSGLDVVVTASPLKFIEDWQAVFESAGLTPIFFGGEANNVARAVIKEGNRQVIVLVNIKESNIILSLVVNGVVYQTSSINFGSSAFTDSLCKYFKISPAEASKLKKEKLYNSHEENMEVFSYLINTISAIKDELYKFILYCNEREDVVGEVDRIILCGQEATIVGLPEYLSLNLNLKVDLANVWINNFKLEQYTPELSYLDSLNYAAVNGLSLS